MSSLTPYIVSPPFKKRCVFVTHVIGPLKMDAPKPITEEITRDWSEIGRGGAVSRHKWSHTEACTVLYEQIFSQSISQLLTDEHVISKKKITLKR